jgi:hypothetical protein
MSLIGTKRTIRPHPPLSAIGQERTLAVTDASLLVINRVVSFGPASTESECSGRGPSRGICHPMNRSRVGFGKYVRRDPIPFFCGLCWQVLAWLARPLHSQLPKAVSSCPRSCGIPRMSTSSCVLYGSGAAAMLNTVGNHIDLFLG